MPTTFKGKIVLTIVMLIALSGVKTQAFSIDLQAILYLLDPALWGFDTAELYTGKRVI